MKRRTLSEAADEVRKVSTETSPQDDETAGQGDSEAVSRDAGKNLGGRPEREEKPVKVTVYLDPDANDALEEAWYRLRKRSGQKLSKSAIASAALRLATRDLDELLGDVRDNE